jgi:hypothetical protein
MKRRIIAAALAIVTAGILITASRWSEQSAKAQADPTNISNQVSGAVSIITDTNNVKWEYLPGGIFKLASVYGTGMYFSPTNKLYFGTANVGSVSALGLYYIGVTNFPPGTNGVVAGITNPLSIFASGGTATGIGLNTNTFEQWVATNKFWLITGNTTNALYPVLSGGGSL